MVNISSPRVSAGEVASACEPMGGNLLHSQSARIGYFSYMDPSIVRARDFRKSMPPPEAALWTALRRRNFAGAKFRRQAPIGPYFADFACFDPKLVIEVDGASHDFEDRALHDARRTIYLERSGFRVVRYAARDVMRDLPAVCEGIAAILAELRAY